MAVVRGRQSSLGLLLCLAYLAVVAAAALLWGVPAFLSAAAPDASKQLRWASGTTSASLRGASALAGAQGAARLGCDASAGGFNYLRAGLCALAAAAGAKALIVQNKGGGHGEIGYHLALNLAKETGMSVTMINDSAAKKEKPPFDSYADLEAAGVTVRWADLSEGADALKGALEGVEACDYVFDNQNVCTKDVQQAVAGWSPKVYAYVSSGGMYKAIPEGPLLETGVVKEDNKQLALERNAADKGLNWCAFRPQYIYGPKTNKPDYLDWFLDRVTRGVEVPIPGDGSLRTTVTNAEDVAAMLASVVGNDAAAKGQVFNCATDVRVSHNEIVEMVAKAVGKDPAEVMKTVRYYDPAKLKGLDLPKKGKFPFRETHFGVGVDKVKASLGWAPSCDLAADLKWYYDEYKRLGKDGGDIVRDWDEAVLKSL